MKTSSEFVFGKRNYTLILIAAVTIFIGFALMTGTSNDNSPTFNNSIFSFRRITLAPIIVIAGYAVCIIGILKKSKP